MWQLYIIVFLWALISLPLYVALLVFLIINRNKEPFSFPFFWLCISNGVIDILGLFHVYPMLIFKYFGLIQWKYWFTGDTLGTQLFRRVASLSGWYLGYAQITNTVVIAINRYTSIVRAMDFVWTSKHMKASLLAPWVLAAVIVLPAAFPDYPLIVMNITLVNSSYTVYEAYPVEEFYSVFLKATAVLLIIYMSVWTVLYMKTFCYVRNHNNSMAENGENVNRKVETRLAIIALVLAVTISLQTICQVCVSFNIASDELNGLLALMWLQMIVINCIINPWVLLGCSKETREKFLQFIKVKKEKTKTAVVPLTHGNRSQPTAA